MSILDFIQRKTEGKKLSMVTVYDYTFANIIAQTQIDSVLVGDSCAMVMHGHETTLYATTDLIATHVKAVAKAKGKQLIIGDMPFLSYRKGLTIAMESIEVLMQAGAHAIKLEGSLGNIELISHVTQSGVPVMGHLGLTPQSVHALGGFKVQGKQENQATQMIEQAKALEQAGCFGVVLECIPEVLGKQITEALKIPTIGIGAGRFTDGQVLVLQDLLGMNRGFQLKFVKTYLNGFELIQNALNHYHQDTLQGIFPEKKHAYSASRE